MNGTEIIQRMSSCWRISARLDSYYGLKWTINHIIDTLHANNVNYSINTNTYNVLTSFLTSFGKFVVDVTYTSETKFDILNHLMNLYKNFIKPNMRNIDLGYYGKSMWKRTYPSDYIRYATRVEPYDCILRILSISSLYHNSYSNMSQHYFDFLSEIIDDMTHLGYFPNTIFEIPTPIPGVIFTTNETSILPYKNILDNMSIKIKENKETYRKNTLDALYKHMIPDLSKIVIGYLVCDV